MRFIVIDDTGRAMYWKAGEKRFIGTVYTKTASTFNTTTQARRRIQAMRESIAVGLETTVNPDKLEIIRIEEAK